MSTPVPSEDGRGSTAAMPNQNPFLVVVDWDVVELWLSSDDWISFEGFAASSHLRVPGRAELSDWVTGPATPGNTARRLHRWAQGQVPIPRSEKDVIEMLDRYLLNMESLHEKATSLLAQRDPMDVALAMLDGATVGFEERAADADALVAQLQVPPSEIVLVRLPPDRPLLLPAFRRFVNDLKAALQLYLGRRAGLPDQGRRTPERRASLPKRSPLKSPLTPDKVSIYFDSANENAYINDKCITGLPASVKTVLLRVASVAQGTIDKEAARGDQDAVRVERSRRGFEPGHLRVMAKGRTRDTFRQWWEGTFGPGEPLMKSGKTNIYRAAWRVLVDPVPEFRHGGS
jgi:hypothetical protein